MHSVQSNVAETEDLQQSVILMCFAHIHCRYLGAKLRYGRIPLYLSGLEEDSRRFGSLHAVQRHMIDCNRCSMLYDGNEDEYEEYYEYP